MQERPRLERKLLVAIDSSSHSHNTLDYLLMQFKAEEDFHFHLLTMVSGQYQGTGADLLPEGGMISMVSPHTRKKLRQRKSFLQEVKAGLESKGVAPERISYEVKLSLGNLAVELVNEARHGLYDALVMGSRGMTTLEAILLGSVSRDVFDICHDVPLWIVDGAVKDPCFLVPVDFTLNSLLAVDHLAFILSGRTDAKITLFHSKALLAEDNRTPLEEFKRYWPERWCEEHLCRPDSHLHAPHQLLLENGFNREQILTLDSSGGFEPAHQIIHHANEGCFGTIVMGRRGPEINKGIFRGVSHRVLLMAEEMAVWVIG